MSRVLFHENFLKICVSTTNRKNLSRKLCVSTTNHKGLIHTVTFGSSDYSCSHIEWCSNIMDKLRGAHRNDRNNNRASAQFNKALSVFFLIAGYAMRHIECTTLGAVTPHVFFPLSLRECDNLIVPQPPNAAANATVQTRLLGTVVTPTRIWEPQRFQV